MTGLNLAYIAAVRLLAAFLLVPVVFASLSAQVDLLPLDHPATRVLERLYHAGSIPTFPLEHLPISRRSAYDFLREASVDTNLPDALREQARWEMVELQTDAGERDKSFIIPVSSDQKSFFDAPLSSRPFTGIGWQDTATGSTIFLDPVLDGEFRYDNERSSSATILQGGVKVRGTVRDIVGFSGKATNGTIVGNDTVVRVDPRYGRSFKFGVIRAQRDIDFGSAHLRADLKGVFGEIGREQLRLGLGGERTLLFGADLPSNTDYLRIGGSVGKVSFTHIHASLLDDTTGIAVGAGGLIPQKYLATHLLSVGPFAGLRFSIGESLIYSGRPFEIGYLNPLNFIKSQEHYLRDRDNSLMYAGMSARLPKGIFLEGEFLLDDLIFSRIGEGFWGNKTAWRVGGSITGYPLQMLDFGISYTRLEPYVYSHFNKLNAYVHDGANMAGSGLDPNSSLLETRLGFWPLPNFRSELIIGLGKHGANVVRDGVVVQNVGGDIRRTFDSTSEQVVEFLAGDLETSTSFDLRIDYEILRDIYLRSRLLSRTIEREAFDTERQMQFWIGLSVGAR